MFRAGIIRSLVATLIVTLGLLFLQPGGASAATTLTLSPTSGPTGTVVTVTGTGFSPSGSLPVTIYFSGTPVASTSTTSTGSFSTTFTVPAAAPATYTVTAASSYASANTGFTVSSSPATISLSPTSGPAGTIVTVSGSGFGANQALTLSFNGVSSSTTITTTNSGTIPAGTSFVVPNVGNGTYTVRVASTTQSATAQFTVSPTSSSLVGSKFVSVNGSAYTTAINAGPGNVLTYQLQFTNNTGNSLNVVATDVLQPGQTIVTTGLPCTIVGTNTLSCPVTVPSGSSASVFFSTVVNSGFSGPITNQATATSTVTGTTTAGPSVTTNATVVNVGTSVPAGATFELCGPVTGYVPAGATSNGSITISGVTVVIAAGTTASNVVLGTNECILAGVNGSGQLISVVGTTNLSGVSVACGVYTTAAAGFVNAGGIPIVVAPGTTFVGGLTAGAVYCFILNSSGQAIGAVAGIPTAAIFPVRNHNYWIERARPSDLTM